MRTYTHHQTGAQIFLIQDENANLVLKDQNSQTIQGNYYCCTFTPTEILLSDGSKVKLNTGEVYTWSEIEKKPIKRRFLIDGYKNKFTKL